MKTNLTAVTYSEQNKEMFEIIKYVELLKKNNITIIEDKNENAEVVKYILNIVNLLKKYKPENYELPKEIVWTDLIFTNSDGKNKDVLSQSLGEVNEMCLIDEILNVLIKNKIKFTLDEHCDLFLLSQVTKNYDEAKLDLVLKIKEQKVNIEFKYLSRALLSLLWKTVWDSNNKDFFIINKNWKKELTYELIQADENYKKTVQKKMFQDLFKIKSVLNKYMQNNTEKLVEYIINKKFNQMRLFKEEEKNILYISIFSYIKKYEIINILFSEWLEKGKDFKIIINKSDKLFINNITFVYKDSGYKFANFELVSSKLVGENKIEYIYKLQKNSNPLWF